MKKNKGFVLIVEDDADLLVIIQEIISKLKYDCDLAKSGIEALDLIEANPKKYSFVVTDLNMPGLSGAQLFEKSRELTKLPFILMTGETELMDMDKAYDMGISEYITKPFAQDDFVACINLVEHELSGRTIVGDSATMDHEYCRIHIKEFVSGSTVNFDLHLKLGDNKYIRVAKQDQPLSRDRLVAYQKKGLNYLYLKKEDFAKYVGLSMIVSKAISKTSIPRHRKLAVLKHSLEVVMQDSFVNGMDREKYTDAKGVVETTMNMVLEHNDLFAMLEMLRQHADQTYSHSLAVSLYGISVAQKWGWTSSMSLNKIAMAGLFHDIGNKEIPNAILSKPRIDLTAEEIKILEGHTTRGQDVLSRIPGIPEEVITIACQHHENMMGRGYPNGLNRARIHPLAALISTVDEFCYLALGPISERMDPKEAISRLFQYKKEELDPHTLKALFEIFNMPVPKELDRILPMKVVA